MSGERVLEPVFTKTPLGALVASILFRAWKKDPPTLSISDDLFEKSVPVLLAGGAGGLSWWRIQNTPFAVHRKAYILQEQFRAEALQAAIQKLDIVRYIRALQSRGIRPLLGKGWSVARLYPEWGLRPCGDIDLYVPSHMFSLAFETLSALRPGCPFDLHRESVDLNDRGFYTMQTRAQTVLIDDTPIKVFGQEDHMRLLCLHAARHGLVRPIWLCDIALMLERIDATFDWEYFFWGTKYRASWIAFVLCLARQLLGAKRLPDLVDKKLFCFPDWAIHTVYKEWSTPYHIRLPLMTYRKHPFRFLQEAFYHWPNPIEATIGIEMGVGLFPRLPLQIAACLFRIKDFFIEKCIKTSLTSS